MSKRICRISAVLVLMVMGLATGVASADDDESQPLYIVRDGKRIPTVIIPPKQANRDRTQRALLEVVELEPYDELAAPQSTQARETTDNDADEEEINYRPRRHYTRYYAGYPISVLHRPGYERYYERYYGYYTPGQGRQLRELYRAERYIQERERGRRFNRRDMRQRKQRVLSNHERATSAGLEDLKYGDYAQAVVALTMAAQLNQGDPACRIHLAQARMAQGHYREGGQTLRRALQLQPKLLYVPLNLSSYYANPTEYDTHVDKLAAWVKENRADGDVYFLLGYMEFQRDDYTAAYAAFRVAARFMPKDSLIQSYLKITKPPTP
ncbi:MAG: tetratricopeptide repeat protein [Planctomycetota bacterium]